MAVGIAEFRTVIEDPTMNALSMLSLLLAARIIAGSIRQGQQEPESLNNPYQ